MYTLLKPLQVREELLERNMRIFTPEEFSRLFQTPKHVTKYFLEKQTMYGLFLRLKKGLYFLKTDPPSEEEIANSLYKPSYISFEYALSYYGILAEMPYTVTSATTKPTRLFTLNNMSFSYYTIKDHLFTGYSLIKLGSKSFLIADKEKALVDYLYFESLGKKPHNDRLNLSGIDKEKLQEYLKLFKRKSFIKYVKRTYVNA
ncbi:MAG: hypothetical protein HYT06_00835 [Candidatus Levybacteria bacterium]|nr:hypothetical protein [Candidatus Levybacteria bacterium]